MLYTLNLYSVISQLYFILKSIIKSLFLPLFQDSIESTLYIGKIDFLQINYTLIILQVTFTVIKIQLHFCLLLHQHKNYWTVFVTVTVTVIVLKMEDEFGII